MRKLMGKTLIVAVLGTVALLVAQEAIAPRATTPEQPKGLGLEPNIGITANNRLAVCKMLNTVLADEYILALKTQNYHWNVTGLMFNDLHLFFGEQYKQLNCTIDAVAERVRALGGKALGTMQEFMQNARLKEQTTGIPESKEMLKNLLADHEAIIISIRADVDSSADEFGDMGTSNFLTDLLAKHEKMAWMLRAYLS